MLWIDRLVNARLRDTPGTNRLTLRPAARRLPILFWELCAMAVASLGKC